jgi:hypothetical protein
VAGLADRTVAGRCIEPSLPAATVVTGGERSAGNRYPFTVRTRGLLHRDVRHTSVWSRRHPAWRHWPEGAGRERHHRADLARGVGRAFAPVTCALHPAQHPLHDPATGAGPHFKSIGRLARGAR